MRLVTAGLVVLLAAPAPAFAQNTPAPEPPEVASTCTPRHTIVGGIGRASVVAFTGAVFGARVCATVANLAIDLFTARIADAPAPDALVTAALTGGGDVTLPLEGATVTGAGPFVIAPGGVFPALGGDTSEVPRVILAYAGQRVLVIGTTPVALVDMARILRDQPDLFGADAVERAVVIASGPGATLSVRGDDGILGSPSVATLHVLMLIKRG
jgi:hypothetical protein